MKLNWSMTKNKQLVQEEWIRVEDALEPIVSKETFQKAQKVFLQNRGRTFQSPPNERFRDGMLTAQLQSLKQRPVTLASKDTEKYGFSKTLPREMLVELVQNIQVFSDNTIEIIWNFKDEYTIADL